MSTVRIVVKCPYCVLEAPDIPSWLQHLGAVHANHPNFNVSCGISGCSTTYQKYSSLKSHVYRQHSVSLGLPEKQSTSISSTPSLTPSYSLYSTEGPDRAVEITPAVASSVRQRSEALLLLKLREVKHVTQSALDDAVNGYQIIFDEAVEEIKSQIQDSLQHDGVEEIVEKALSSIDEPKPFTGLETAYLQRKYYKQELGMLVRKSLLDFCIPVLIL